MIIRLTESDIHSMVKDVATRILEQYVNIEDDYLTRIPYPIELIFTDHAEERESQRTIHEEEVREDMKAAVRWIVDDFKGGKLTDQDYFKVINKETRNVSVAALFLDKSKKRIRRIIVVTSYVWDGRMNIDKGIIYYVGEESPAYAEAVKWNAENQDKVVGYMDWKRNNDLKRLARKAENEYQYRNNSQEMPPEKRMALVNRTYDNYEKAEKQRYHDMMDPDELNAIRNYYKNVDKRPMSSKFSPNRDLRALDLWKKRKESQEQ